MSVLKSRHLVGMFLMMWAAQDTPVVTALTQSAAVHQLTVDHLHHKKKHHKNKHKKSPSKSEKASKTEKDVKPSS